MTVEIEDMILKYDGHRTLIVTKIRPSWFERKILRIHETIQHYSGHNTQWVTVPQMKPVQGKLLDSLTASEKRWEMTKRMQPKAKFREAAAVVNKIFNGQ